MVSKLKAKIILLGLLAAGLPTGYALYMKAGRSQLDRSINIFLAQYVDSGYEIKTKKMDRGIDSSGAWWLTSKYDSAIKDIVISGFQPGNTEDLLYYLDKAQRYFKLPAPLDRYRLLSGSVRLGKGSICETQECSIDVLSPSNGMNLFIFISKT